VSRAVDVILLGAPGAGKGTQATRISGELGLLHVSTGDILRAAVAAGTPLGKSAQEYMDRGDLVPDEVIVGVVAERLQEADCAGGVLFDGFPRTLPQAEALTQVLAEQGRAEPKVLAIEVAEAALVRRLSERRTCRACAGIFSVDALGGAPECPKCGGELYQRADDAPESVAQRLRVYAAQTAPLLDYYAARGSLRRVDGEGAVEEIARAALAALSAGAA
jgi:adenylate kinase